MQAKRIFVNLYSKNQIVELSHNNLINDDTAFNWLQKNNIADYNFVLLNYGNTVYYVSTSAFQIQL